MAFAFEERLRVDRSREAVFGFITDPDRLAVWQPNLLSIDVTPPGELRQGSRMREVRRGPFGRTVEATVEVVRHEPPSVFELRVLEGARVDGTWTLATIDADRCELVFRCDSQLPRLARPAVRRIFRQAHARLKQHLE
jgi:hypothetical protein